MPRALARAPTCSRGAAWPEGRKLAAAVDAETRAARRPERSGRVEELRALGLVIRELAGRLHGFAVRVPVPTGSLADLTIEGERETTKEEINAAFAARADTGPLTGILPYSEEPIVSSDIVKSPYSSIFDAPLTSVIDGTQVKVVAWYDNEWAYANRLLELAERVAARVPAPAA